ncbi:MAG: BrnA antitoxin family protein [Bdellovibrio sp.]|nr:BrnA antitoxin family protein [Bdellovibrio sp.]
MGDQYDFSNAKKTKKTKEIKILKTFRLDPDVIEWLEEQGEKQGIGYQTFLNWFLKKSMGTVRSLEDRLGKLEEVVYRKKA